MRSALYEKKQRERPNLYFMKRRLHFVVKRIFMTSQWQRALVSFIYTEVMRVVFVIRRSYRDSSSNNAMHKRRNSSLCLLDRFGAFLLQLYVSMACNLYALLRKPMIESA